MAAQDRGGGQQHSPGHRRLSAFTPEQIVQVDSFVEHRVEISPIHEHDWGPVPRVDLDGGWFKPVDGDNQTQRVLSASADLR
jgi:hypothetical protein